MNPPTSVVGPSGGGGTMNTGGSTSSLSNVSWLVKATQAIFASVPKSTSDPDQAALFEKLAETWKSLN